MGLFFCRARFPKQQAKRRKNKKVKGCKGSICGPSLEIRLYPREEKTSQENKNKPREERKWAGC